MDARMVLYKLGHRPKQILASIRSHDCQTDTGRADSIVPKTRTRVATTESRRILSTIRCFDRTIIVP